MRVAYVCADAGVPVFGTKGCSVHVQEIIKQFLRSSNHVTLYAVRSGGANCWQSPDFHCEEFPIGTANTTSDRELLQLQAAQQIATRLATNKVDLVYERYSLWSCESIVQAKGLGIPTILEVNAPLIEEQQQHRDLVGRAEAVSIRDRAFLDATCIVAVSEAVAAYVRDHLPLAERTKVHVVANGVDTERFSPNVPPHSPNPQFTVGFLGTLKPWHGLESLIAAFQLAHQKRPEMILRIIGDGPLRDTLEQQIENDMPSLRTNVQWVGAVHPHDVPGHLAALDVAVAPYVETSNFYFSPLKVYEYMASGLAVVASAIGQLETVLDHDQNGLLYKPGDIQQLADCLCRLAGQPALVSRLGIEARRTAIERHSWRHTLEVILAHVTNDQAESAARLMRSTQNDLLHSTHCTPVCQVRG